MPPGSITGAKVLNGDSMILPEATPANTFSHAETEKTIIRQWAWRYFSVAHNPPPHSLGADHGGAGCPRGRRLAGSGPAPPARERLDAVGQLKRFLCDRSLPAENWPRDRTVRSVRVGWRREL